MHIATLIPTYTLCGILGVAIHAYLKKFIKEEITCSIYEYFFINNKKATIATIATFIGIIAPALQTVDYTTGFAIQTAIGFFTLGYTCDSAFNRE